MRAYELAFPETATMNQNDVVGPLTATVARVNTEDGRPQNITGNTDLGDLTSNPITSVVKSYLSDHDVGLRLLFIGIGLIVLTIAVLRLTFSGE